MSITTPASLRGIQAVSQAVALTLRAMRTHARPGMSAWELDAFGGALLRQYGAQSAPRLTYGFPGWTCICVNEEVAHGIPSPDKVFREGDLINIDVSAELNGYWADNGASFVLGKDLHGHQPLVATSEAILSQAIGAISAGVRISQIGHLIETEARRAGFRVIRNLAGHGIGRSLHEAPADILNWNNRRDRTRFRRGSVVAIETFISTTSAYAQTAADGWTLLGDRGGYVAQHEHTIVVTEGAPLILTQANGIGEAPAEAESGRLV